LARYETIIQEIIYYLLKVGGGDCQIGVRSVAKAAMHELGLEESMSGRAFMYETVVRIIGEYDSELCDLRSTAHYEDMSLAPLSLRIYQVRG